MIFIHQHKWIIFITTYIWPWFTIDLNCPQLFSPTQPGSNFSAALCPSRARRWTLSSGWNLMVREAGWGWLMVVCGGWWLHKSFWTLRNAVLTVKNKVLTSQNGSSIMRNPNFACRLWLAVRNVPFPFLFVIPPGLGSSSNHYPLGPHVLACSAPLQTRNPANHCHLYIWKLSESWFRVKISFQSCSICCEGKTQWLIENTHLKTQ